MGKLRGIMSCADCDAPAIPGADNCERCGSTLIRWDVAGPNGLAMTMGYLNHETWRIIIEGGRVTADPPPVLPTPKYDNPNMGLRAQIDHELDKVIVAALRGKP